MSLINREELLNAFGLSENTRKHGGDGSGYNTLMLYEIQDTIEDAAEAEPPKMHWTEKQVVSVKEAGVEELQSAKCSNCGRYHTTPYMYYFDEANYCPYCGFKKE